MSPLPVKFMHEVRDPIHAFVRMNSYERDVVNSFPYQRLRNVHQLALSYLVYPGATHRRFEHCLGVMELAGRLFDTVVQRDNLRHAEHLVPQLAELDTQRHWRAVVRMAALCHDLGHQPFSHAGEELLPDGETHETITKRLIESDYIRDILVGCDFPIQPEHVIEIAVPSPDGLAPWKQLLAEIVQSNFFGVDRIDYLLRDSHHAGVAYGRFDHFRLLDTVRILPPAPADESQGVEATPALGVEGGGVQSAEGLLLARHFMFSQVYLHPVRRIYDRHLTDFLALWLPDGKFAIDTESILGMTDNKVLVAIQEAAGNPDHPAHDPARRITTRNHFKLLYQPSQPDYRENLEAGHEIAAAAELEFGTDAVRHSFYPPKNGALDFPVLVKGEVEAASSRLEVLTKMPPTRFDAVFIDPAKRAEAESWLKDHKDQVLADHHEEADDAED